MKSKGRAIQCTVILFSFLLLCCITGTLYAAIPAEKVFMQNFGQWDKAAKFHMFIGQTQNAQRSQVELWLTEKGYIYHLSDLSPLNGKDAKRQETQKVKKTPIAQHAVSVSFAGALKPRIETEGVAPGTYNWLIGKDTSRHITGAKAYQKVTYRRIYPGIDVTFDAAMDTAIMETTFTVAPGADPGAIALSFKGADALKIDSLGNLVLATSLGTITELHPIAFQLTTTGKREQVPVSFALNGDTLRFKVGCYDSTRPLLIDPVVVFSRTFGGSNTDSVFEMHEDGTGRYLTGTTQSSDFPTTAGAYQVNASGGADLFAAKFNPANQTLLWATYIGTSANEFGGNSALAPDGSLYLVGHTQGGATWPPNPPTYTYGPLGNYDVGIVHLSANGQSVLSGAVIGGTDIDYAGDVSLNGTDVYVCGSSLTPVSTGFPTVAGGFNTTENNNYVAFILRFNAALSSYLNMTFVPGDTSTDGANGIAFDGSNNVYVYGTTLNTVGYPATATIGPLGNYDLFVAKYDAALATQVYNVAIGGGSTDPTAGFSYTTTPNSYYNNGNSGIIVDGSNRAWVTGTTASSDFPTTPGAYQTTNGGNYDVFVLALNAGGTALAYSTFIGGSSTDVGKAIRFDSLGNVYIAGSAASSNYPTTPGAPQETIGGGYDFVLSILSPDLSQLLFSTYWGGSSADYAADVEVGPSGEARISGSTGGGFSQVPAGSLVFGTGGGFDGGVASFTDLLPRAIVSVLTFTQWGMVIFLLLAGFGSAYYMRKQRKADH